jgi:DNA-binding CsgD family transcriptional regulator
LTVPEAAAELGLTARTAERRIESARRILGVRSTAEAVVAAMAVDR